MYKQLGLGSPKPICMILLMVDQMVKKLVCIFCDVLVKEDFFLFPSHFMSLNYEVDFIIPHHLRKALPSHE